MLRIYCSGHICDFGDNARDWNLNWSGNALVTFDKNGTQHPVLHAFNEEGTDSPALIDIPEAAIVNIGNAAQSADGSLGACGIAIDTAGHKAGFIYTVSSDRSSSHVIRMSGFYYPRLVAMMPDGSIWVKGWEPRDSAGSLVKEEAPMIRHFDAAGTLIGQFLSQRTVMRVVPRHIATSGLGFLAASPTRVGWIQSYSHPVYFEISQGGTTAQYPGLPMAETGDTLSGLVITDGDDVYAYRLEYVAGESRRKHLYTLDRDLRKWNEVVMPKESPFRDVSVLIGAQGRALVFATTNIGVSQVVTLK